MSDDLKWLIGTAVVLILSFSGTIITAFSNLSTRIKKGDDALAALQKQEDDRLHERINRVRDEYVRRDDLDKDITMLERGLDQLRNEMRETTKSLREDMRANTAATNDRLDKLIAIFADGTTRRNS